MFALLGLGAGQGVEFFFFRQQAVAFGPEADVLLL